MVCYQVEHPSIAAGNLSLASFVGRYPGCYTRMILGYGCMAPPQTHPPGGLTADAVAAATERVSRFRFVGILAHWRLSMCLFNRVVMGVRGVWPVQLVNTRPTAQPSHARALASPPSGYTKGKTSTRYNMSGLPEDSADQQVYEFALARFHRDLAQHGISDEDADCPLLAHGNWTSESDTL
jgi:hypothetical protein